MSAARTEILGRIRSAFADGRPEVHDGPQMPSAPPMAADAAAARFAERVADYRATVTTTGTAPEDIGFAVAGICAAHGVGTLAVPEGVPAAWIPGGLTAVAVPDGGARTVRALDRVDGVLTGCALGIAETGTIVLDAGPAQGPRAATLVPDLHVCVVHASDVVAGVPEAVALMEAAVRASGRPLTLISGPSATSDIELDRVEGVHGPRRLEVVLAG